MPTTSPASSSARHASISRFSSKGSPTCTLGRLAASASSSEKPAEASTLTPPMPSRPGGRAEQHGEVADARWPGRARGGRSGSTPRHSTLTSGLLGVGLVEHGLAADGRARRPSCRSRRSPLTTPFGDPAAAGVVERAEAQRVHQRDRPGAHGEDVAEDAADAGGRALVGLDGRRVVVALDADGGGDAVADVDHAGVLARARRAPTAPRSAGARRWSRDDLYEQCSDHITAYIASSRWLGARPRIALDVGGLVVGETQRAMDGGSRRRARGRSARPQPSATPSMRPSHVAVDSAKSALPT